MLFSNTVCRVIQESLTNVTRHAGVDSVNILAWADSKTLIVRIEDSGVGFEMEKNNKIYSNGLQGMHERVSLFGGRLDIESTPGKGTCIIAEIPIPENIENKEQSG